MQYVITSSFDGFGDELMTALFTQILVDNGVDAVLMTGNMELTTVPRFKSTNEPVIQFHFGYNFIPVPIMYQNIQRFQEVIGRTIKITRNCIPVVYYDIANVTPVDVVLNTKTVKSNTKDWMYWNELTQKLTDANLTWTYLDDKFNVRLLNHVHKSKVYVGIESGVSHYVSALASGKAIIIQSGFVAHEFWSLYDYEYLEMSPPCKQCSLTWAKNCPLHMKCLTDITPDMVMKAILKKLNKTP